MQQVFTGSAGDATPPPFIQRGDFQFALAGHWLLLGALCLYAGRSRGATPLWALLCLAAALDPLRP